MARVSNPLIGKSRNKIGGVVFSSWKGINTLREKPATVANPKTPAQRAQRSAFAQMVAMGRAILGAIQISFRQRAVQMSEFNAFMRLNLDEAFTISGATATFDPTKLVGASGTLLGFDSLAFVSVSGRTADYDWTDNSGQSGANASDTVHAVIVSADGLNIAHVDTGALRNEENASVVIPGTWNITGARVAMYLLTVDNTQASDSQNLPAA